jgi:FtsH-binding integral membrane protein
MSLTIGGMLAVANTPIAEAVLWLYDFGLILGVLVFGGLLGLGRKYGLKGISTDDTSLAILGSGVSVLTYALFGGAILTQYATDTYFEAILLALGVTVGITILASLYVIYTSRNLQFVERYSGYSFLVGILFALIGTFLPVVSIVAFVFFLLGFLLDLVFEIWMYTDNQRTPVANGFGIYIAFAGVFVHILQIALRSADDLF